MASYNPAHLGQLLTAWGAGSLDYILDHGHVLPGVRDVVMTGAGMQGMGLCQRFLQADVDRVLEQMLLQHQRLAHLLITKYLLLWTMERIARAYGHSSTSVAYSEVMQAEDVFAGLLLDP
jgi:hypothetical protein